MWKLTKSFSFEAAHRLPSHAGKCHRMHGHNWKGHAVLESSELQQEGPAAGMIMDFAMVKASVQSVVDEYLDHYCINDRVDLANPTSEELARWLFDHLKPRLPQLAAIILDETEGSSCEYRP